MALYTQADAKTELTDRLGGRDDLAGSLNRLEHWLDAAKLDLAKTEIELPGLTKQATASALTTAVSEYTWTSSPISLSDPLGIHHVTNTTTGQLMSWINWEEYRALVNQAQGAPVRWTRLGNLLAFDPQPKTGFLSILLFDYRTRPTTNVLTEFEDEWHELIIELAWWRGLKALHKFTEAKEVYDTFPGYVKVMLALPTNQTMFEQKSNYEARVYV